MNKLDPKELFESIARDVPKYLQQHVFVTGSLAAAYHYNSQLHGHAVNTKDADLVVHPAGHVDSCRDMAQHLRDVGWRCTSDCYPQARAEPVDTLRAIRLFPPGSNEYFIEFLNVPEAEQTDAKRWAPVEMKDGWYGLPSFRFLGITSMNRVASHSGLEYAQPSLMALANLLSHPRVGTERIQSGDMTGILRSAKDLGRVIALAQLEGRDGVEAWFAPWLSAMKTYFPAEWQLLAANLGSGLEELLGDVNALEDAQKTTDIGLLNGLNVSVEMLRASGKRILQDLIVPLRTAAVSKS